MVFYYRHTNRGHLPIRYVRGFYLHPLPHSPHAQFADNFSKQTAKVQWFLWCFLGVSTVFKANWKTTFGWQAASPMCCLQATRSDFCLHADTNELQMRSSAVHLHAAIPAPSPRAQLFPTSRALDCPTTASVCGYTASEPLAQWKLILCAFLHRIKKGSTI